MENICLFMMQNNKNYQFSGQFKLNCYYINPFTLKDWNNLIYIGKKWSSGMLVCVSFYTLRSRESPSPLSKQLCIASGLVLS